MSFIIGVFSGLFVMGVGYVLTNLAIKSEPKMAMNYIGAGFFIKAIMCGILCYAMPQAFSELVPLQFGMGMGLMVCMGLPVIAIAMTNKTKKNI